MRAARRCAAARFATVAPADDEYLPVKLAFKHSVAIVNGESTVNYQIAPGYYLYRDRLGFESATPGVTVGAASFPVGEDHEDDYFGRQVIYRGDVSIGVPARLRRAAARLRPQAQAAGLRGRGTLLPAPDLDHDGGRSRGFGRH